MLIIGLGWYITDKVVEPRIMKTEIDGDAEDLPEMHDLRKANARACAGR